MASTIKIGVPYEVTLLAGDTKSGKPISNTLYYRYLGVGPYGDGIGGTSNETFTNAVLARWVTFVLNAISSHYVMVSIRSRAIMGWKFGTPLRPWVGLSPSLTFTSITTGTPHGFTNGSAVALNGTVGGTPVNTVVAPITITTSTTFTVPIVLAAGAPVVGTVQEVQGGVDFVYEDQFEVADTSAGARPGEAVPLFCSASVRRLNTGVGRNFKSRISLSPIAEPDQVNGKFEAVYLAILQTAVDALNNSEDSGGAFNLFPIVVSRALAFQQPQTFTQALTWTKEVTDFQARPNLGSITSRKPRLSLTIAS